MLDGRKGIIPSNYIERLSGEDLLEFHRDVVMGLAGDPSDPLSMMDPWSTAVPTNIPLDPYGGGGFGGMGVGLGTGNLTSPDGGLMEPSMPYSCK